MDPDLGVPGGLKSHVPRAQRLAFVSVPRVLTDFVVAEFTCEEHAEACVR